MIHLSRKTRLTCALWLVLAAGCAQLPPATMSQQIGTCEKLSIVQGGKEVESTNGVFRLDRQPFIVRYRGAEKEPALAASPTNNLVDALQQRGRKELWASGGDFMAFSPNDLPLVPEFQIFVDEKSRAYFASVIGGEEYVELLRNLIATNPELDTATYIPKAGGGFEPGKSGAGYAFDVRTIHHQPIAQTRFSQSDTTRRAGGLMKAPRGGLPGMKGATLPACRVKGAEAPRTEGVPGAFPPPLARECTPGSSAHPGRRCSRSSLAPRSGTP